jgi:hypothetical protein
MVTAKRAPACGLNFGRHMARRPPRSVEFYRFCSFFFGGCERKLIFLACRYVCFQDLFSGRWTPSLQPAKLAEPASHQDQPKNP